MGVSRRASPNVLDPEVDDPRYFGGQGPGRSRKPHSVVSAVHFILYVRDQTASSAFYRTVLVVEPRLDVPGMTEIALGANVVLGLMPESGIRRLLGAKLPDPATANRAPRAEVYLRVDDPSAYHARALAAGAVELSPPAKRDWGHIVAYSLDPDGHVLAFAS